MRVVHQPSLETELSTPDLEAFEEALDQARRGFAEGGVPVGATLAIEGVVISAGHNERIQRGDPIAHGEMACIRSAGRRRDYAKMTLFTTLAPCDMCTGAILLFGIPRVVIGEATTFPGNIGYLREQGVDVSVLEDPRCIDLMMQFQTLHPELWREDIGE